MSDYVTISEFSKGWKIFIEKITHYREKKWGTFPCSAFSCSGCDDWLDADKENRNVDKIDRHIYRRVTSVFELGGNSWISDIFTDKKTFVSFFDC